MKNPNRIVAYVVAGLGLATAVLPVIADVDFTTMAGAITGLTAVTAVALKWLTGWQNNVEKPEAQARLLAMQHAINSEAEATAIEAAKQAGSARGKNIAIPR